MVLPVRPHKINSLVLRPNFPKLDEGGRLFFFFFIVKKTDEGGFFLFGKEILLTTYNLKKTRFSLFKQLFYYLIRIAIKYFNR